MQPLIKRIELANEYFFEEGCYITEVSNSTDDPDLSIARARVEPGVTTRLHCLENITERYVIINGKGVVEIGARIPQTVKAGDVVIIPPLHPQRITNTGSKDLIFLAICSPRYNIKFYQDILD